MAKSVTSVEPAPEQPAAAPQLSSTDHSIEAFDGNTEKPVDDSPVLPANAGGEPESLEDINRGWKDYLPISILCCMIAFGGFVFGFDTGTISGFVNMSDFQRRFASRAADGTYYFTNVRTGLVIGIFNAGCAIGAFIIPKAGDLWGRRVGIMIAMIIYICGLIVQIASQYAWYQYMIGRIITGIAVGALSVLCPLFISETSPKKIRGTLVVCFQLMITLGIFIGYCVVYRTRHYDNSRQWRIPVGLCFAWALFLLIGMVPMPESPRYLVSKGYIERAKKSIAKSNKVSPEHPAVYSEIALIQTGIDRESSEGGNVWKELFTGKPKIFYRLFLGIMLQSLQQLTGDNYYFYYGTTIFKAAHIDSFKASIILGVVNFGFTFVGIYVIDKFGRRRCLLVGSTGMSIFMLIYTLVGSQSLYLHGQHGPTDKSSGDALIFVSVMFIAFFASTWAGGCYAIVSELYPSRVRTPAMAIATLSNWIWGFLISFFTSFITTAIGFYLGFVFFGCLLFSIPFVYFCVSETKGLSLEEVDLMYYENVLPWKSSKWVPPTKAEQKAATSWAAHDAVSSRGSRRGSFVSRNTSNA
ncbi:hypothetical protein DIURU_002307 [Diutina rugosa]|uniref:Major facilitator superfamily (MFS) profile domain-containing protein n=1 Tax=Diutina rugosa TaxID=5481 RepID=A0A642UVQ5_DIURU|nr:uncharacterized protein DIURU_002307 [Diutina rugosa]KAA8903795.1 hypothetical protein DIURU_002307 [Diutina rugosa]